MGDSEDSNNNNNNNNNGQNSTTTTSATTSNPHRINRNSLFPQAIFPPNPSSHSSSRLQRPQVPPDPFIFYQPSFHYSTRVNSAHKFKKTNLRRQSESAKQQHVTTIQRAYHQLATLENYAQLVQFNQLPLYQISTTIKAFQQWIKLNHSHHQHLPVLFRSFPGLHCPDTGPSCVSERSQAST
jgi:hypothetical protein